MLVHLECMCKLNIVEVIFQHYMIGILHSPPQKRVKQTHKQVL